MKTALIFGSSGRVGKSLLNQIINNSNYSKVKIFVRSSLEISDPKVEIINTDFKDLQKIKNLIIFDKIELTNRKLMHYSILNIIFNKTLLFCSLLLLDFP